MSVSEVPPSRIQNAGNYVEAAASQLPSDHPLRKKLDEILIELENEESIIAFRDALAQFKQAAHQLLEAWEHVPAMLTANTYPEDWSSFDEVVLQIDRMEVVTDVHGE